MLYNAIEDLIGQTPLLKIDPKVHGLHHIDLYAKLEYYNPFGSVKDRIAKGMLDPHWDELEAEKKTVIESSSGNTGKAVAALCSIHGLPFKTITNRIKVPEQRMIMQVLGADIEELPGFSECPDPSDPNNAVAMSEKLVTTQPEKYFYPNQYFSELNVQAHEKAGEEVNHDLGAVDYYIGFLGTTGSTLGAGRAIKKKNPDAKIIGIIAEAHNHIPGGREVQEMWEVGLFDKSFYSEILSGTITQAIDGMMTLIRQCGILCGPTTGVNYSAGLAYLKKEDEKMAQTGERKKAVIIACDRVEPYLSYLKKHRPELFSAATTSQPQVNQIKTELVKAVSTISSAALHTLPKNKTMIVDIRGNFAYNIGHIPGSINLPSDIFSQLIEQGSMFPMQTTIIVVCRVGDLSRKYAAFLQQQNYESSSLDGGIMAWKVANFPFERTKSHDIPTT